MVSSEYCLRYIKEHPGCTCVDIVESLGEPKWKRDSLRSNIARKCGSLEKFGIV